MYRIFLVAPNFLSHEQSWSTCFSTFPQHVACYRILPPTHVFFCGFLSFLFDILGMHMSYVPLLLQCSMAKATNLSWLCQIGLFWCCMLHFKHFKLFETESCWWNDEADVKNDPGMCVWMQGKSACFFHKHLKVSAWQMFYFCNAFPYDRFISYHIW